MSALSDELLPCPNPWCGGYMHVTERRAHLWRVRCGCGVQADYAATEAEAIAAWNKRTPDPTMAEVIGELVEAATAAAHGALYAYVNEKNIGASEYKRRSCLIEALEAALARANALAGEA